MKSTILLFVMLNTGALLLSGCGQSPMAALKKAYSPSPDKDVTASPEYNFSSFTGTVWKTTVKMAIADLKRYTGAKDTMLLPPDCFDPTEPGYNPPAEMQLIAVLPPGTRLRIARLLQDQGVGGICLVEAVLEDGTYAQKAVYLGSSLLAGNRWISGPYSNTNWGVNPDRLEPSRDSDRSAPSVSEITDTPQSGYKKGYSNGRACAIRAQKAVAGNHLSGNGSVPNGS
jgi:hypothetical protein